LCPDENDNRNPGAKAGSFIVFDLLGAPRLLESRRGMRNDFD